MLTIKDRQFEKMIPAFQLQERIAQLAHSINEDYADRQPLFVPVLNGAFMFAADLLKHITISCQVSFIKLASYQGTQSTGEVEEILGFNDSVRDRDIVILEDIVDTGLTLREIQRSIHQFQPQSIEVATLLLKPKSLRAPVSPKYVGQEIPDNFVVGYGLDYDGLGRNLPDLYTLSENSSKTGPDIVN